MLALTKNCFVVCIFCCWNSKIIHRTKEWTKAISRITFHLHNKRLRHYLHVTYSYIFLLTKCFMFHNKIENMYVQMCTRKPANVYMYNVNRIWNIKNTNDNNTKLYQSHRKQSGHLIEVVIVPNNVKAHLECTQHWYINHKTSKCNESEKEREKMNELKMVDIKTEKIVLYALCKRHAVYSFNSILSLNFIFYIPQRAIGLESPQALRTNSIGTHTHTLCTTISMNWNLLNAVEYFIDLNVLHSVCWTLNTLRSYMFSSLEYILFFFHLHLWLYWIDFMEFISLIFDISDIDLLHSQFNCVQLLFVLLLFLRLLLLQFPSNMNVLLHSNSPEQLL